MKIGIVTDIHEDVVNLKIALKFFGQQKCDKVFCLGDIVGFAEPFYSHFRTRNANECIKLIRFNCNVTVAGNHDMFAVKKLPDYFKKQGFPNDWFDLPPEKRAEISTNKAWLYEDEIKTDLTDNNLEFLLSLPEIYTCSLEGKKIMLSHFIAPDLTGSTNFFPEKSRDLVPHLELMAENGTNISLTGHSHVEGLNIGHTGKLKNIGFGVHNIRNKQQILMCPAVASSQRISGIAILDLSGLIIQTIRLY